jgi:hypothetical protein
MNLANDSIMKVKSFNYFTSGPSYSVPWLCASSLVGGGEVIDGVW